jgi:electron transport complex protein RnfC
METVIKKKSVFRGLSLPENKRTAKVPIEELPVPEKVILPLQQNIGAPCESSAKRKDIVKTGQKIADSKSYVSAPIHSSVSGSVSKVTKVLNPATCALTDALVIESDGEDQWIDFKKLFDIEKSDDFSELKKIIRSLEKKKILEKIREAGVVGLGGATFPTHVKLNPPKDKKINTLILNGCECEPFITSDHRIMLEYGEKVLAGLYIISRTIMPKDIYIAVEDNKKDAIHHLEELIVKMGFKNTFKIVTLKSSYPMGAEKTLIRTILKRAVPMGGLPMDVGVIVNNVATAKSVYEAVIEGRPLMDKVVTVTGEVASPKNLLVRMGTPVSNLLEACGKMGSNANCLIIGGPMMGTAIADIDFPVTKGVNCILVKEGKARVEQNCINCGRCVSICPMDLMPLVYVRYVKKGSAEGCRQYYIENCIECGSCAYVCPAGIPIVGYIKTGKSMLQTKKL